MQVLIERRYLSTQDKYFTFESQKDLEYMLGVKGDAVPEYVRCSCIKWKGRKAKLTLKAPVNTTAGDILKINIICLLLSFSEKIKFDILCKSSSRRFT